MISFKDFYDNTVRYSFKSQPFCSDPKHVWVICRYDNQWLLTRHKNRGIEFPGGKVEQGESAEAAAKREVYEETGGDVEELIYIGQYEVTGKDTTVYKNVYFAKVRKLIKKHDYMETEGPVLLESLPGNISSRKEYSFMMKDRVLAESLSYIEQHEWV